MFIFVLRACQSKSFISYDDIIHYKSSGLPKAASHRCVCRQGVENGSFERARAAFRCLPERRRCPGGTHHNILLYTMRGCAVTRFIIIIIVVPTRRNPYATVINTNTNGRPTHCHIYRTRLYTLREPKEIRKWDPAVAVVSRREQRPRR